MPTTYNRSYDEWYATLRDIARRDDPRIDLGDLVDNAAADLATHHDALENPCMFLDALESASWDHYDAAHDEADNRFTDNDRALPRVYNVAWAALYLWYFDRLWSAVYGTVPDHRLTDPGQLT